MIDLDTLARVSVGLSLFALAFAVACWLHANDPRRGE